MCYNANMILKEWAEKQGISYRTALRWFHEGRMPVPAWQHGEGYAIVVDEAGDAAKLQGVHLYARVSSHDQKADLRRQRDRLEAFAASRGWVVLSIAEEIGSGLNGKRPKLMKILKAGDGDVCVEHADRLSRFGVAYIEAALESSGRNIHVINKTECKMDIVQDFIDVVTSMCARIYGRRSAKNKATRIISAAQE